MSHAPWSFVLTAWLLASSASIAAGQSRPAPKAPAPAPAEKAVPRSNSPGSAEFNRLTRDAAAARDAGRIDESVALYKRAVALRPSWAEGYWFLGTAFYELDKYADAKSAFARVARLQPKHAAAFGFKGLCEFQLKDYESALDDLMHAADLGITEPKDLAAAIGYHTAATLTRLEKYEFALGTLQSFARDGNDSPKIIETFGMALLRIPMVPSELPPDRREIVMLAGRAAYYHAARKPAAAKPAFELLVQRYPDTPNVHYAYGVFLLEEDPDGGIREFKQELKISPDHLPSILQIAFEYLRRSDWDSAKPWAQRAVDLDPRDFAARRALGQVLLETGSTAESIAQLEAGVRIASDSPSLRFMLARAYQKAGRQTDAERERAEFLRLDRLIRGRKQGTQALGGISERGSFKPE
jgi:tetratricopeptide (TPR) repeat protein